MSTFAAVMTGKGTGAISTVQLFGKNSKSVLKKVFKPTGKKSAEFKTGQIILGTINDGSEIIDQVTVGCEGPENFAINCHGNPLIVEMIMRLLAQHGAKLITARQLLYEILASKKSLNTIEIEAKLTQPEAKTLTGTKIIANQTHTGLNEVLNNILKNMNKISIDEIKASADTILQNSRTAKLIMFGCKTVIAGPPNSGKSSLLNCLAGRQKAVVTNIAGTTRDWVSADCLMEPLLVELIDTAGLYEQPPTNEHAIEKAARKKSLELLQQADLVLLVLDNNPKNQQLDTKLPQSLAHKLVLTVINKSDLPDKLQPEKLPRFLADTVKVSAKFGTAITELIEKIHRITGSADYDIETAVCFTERQQTLLKELKKAESKDHAGSIIKQFLTGRLKM